jgi:hypothetical protein
MQNAAHYGAILGELSILHFLKNNKADLTLKDKKGLTPKGWLLQEHGNRDLLVELFLQVEIQCEKQHVACFGRQILFKVSN